MGLIKNYGEMWVRNAKSIESVPGSSEDGQGVYVLYDGSMPVYIGMGNIRQRIRNARVSNRRGQMWDHFSWYVPSSSALIRDIECLLLRMLPFYLRILNRHVIWQHDPKDLDPEDISFCHEFVVDLGLRLIGLPFR